MPPRPEYYRAIQMNTSVRKEVIDALGGIQDTLKPIEKSLRQHEMRPFDVEPNYLEELMLSKNPNNFRSTSSMGMKKNTSSNAVTTNNEFLKMTMRDRNFIKSHGKIISASPFRAIVRRMDYEQMLGDHHDDDRSKEENEKEDDEDFERDHEGLKMTYE